MSFKNYDDEEQVMHSKSDKIEIMIMMKQMNRFQNDIEKKKNSECVFNYFHLLYYRCY